MFPLYRITFGSVGASNRSILESCEYSSILLLSIGLTLSGTNVLGRDFPSPNTKRFLLRPHFGTFNDVGDVGDIGDMSDTGDIGDMSILFKLGEGDSIS